MAKKSITQASDNYEGAIPIVRARYEQGVQDGDWSGGVKNPAAKKNYEEGIRKAISNDSWGKGVSKVSNEDWKQASLTKGAANIEEGMRQGKEKYERNFAPILTAMNTASDKLPARTTDANQNIDARLKPIVKAAQEAAKRA